MPAPFPATDPLLQGAFAPLGIEYDHADLLIEGAFPRELDGVLYRIGPNAQFAPRGPYNPLQGEGMIHAFDIRGGRVAYRNRWVRTRRWRLERQAGRALYSTSDPRAHDPLVRGEPDEGAANTHIIMHAGRLLALEEGHLPIEIVPDTLETRGSFDFGGRLRAPMTAHPKICPQTGEMLFFSNFPDQAFDGALLLHTVDPAGELTRSVRIAGPYPALVHDFAITRTRIVLVVCPLTISLERLRRGAPPIAWEPPRGAFVGMAPRADPAAVQWWPAPACMVWHVLNAFDEGDRVQLDLCSQAAPAFPAADGTPPSQAALRQRLARWTVDPAASAVAVRQLHDMTCEYPRIDERRTGLPYRYGFVATLGGPGTGDLHHRGLARHDHLTGQTELWSAPPGHAVSEPVFVPRDPAAAEGEGHLLATLYDEARDASRLALFDAQALAQGPIAAANLDHRVPAGFHGSFVPRGQLGDVRPGTPVHRPAARGSSGLDGPGA